MKGSAIDVDALVTQLDKIEQAPIDKLGIRVTKQEDAIRDLGIIKTKMSIFQAALQDFTDPVSYLNKSAVSSNVNVATATITNSSDVSAGMYSLAVQQLAKASTKIVDFDFDIGGSIALGIVGDENSESFEFGSGQPVDTLEKLRNAINQSSTGIRAAIVDTGLQTALMLTSIAGGLDSQIELEAVDGITSGAVDILDGGQDGDDARFTINGIEFSRNSNTVDDALPGIRLQLLDEGAAANTTIIASSANTTVAETLITNLGQAYNDLIFSYTEFAKFNSNPEKRGTLYGFMDLRTLIDSISLSFMQPLTRSGQPLLDSNSNPISFTSLGLELQLDGSLLFDAEIYQSAAANGALDQISNGSVSPTRALVNDAMTFGGRVDSFISSFEEQKLTIENRIKDLEERKTEKMARYKAQYAALDALLYRLQALNSSLTPTFEALNNQNKN